MTLVLQHSDEKQTCFMKERKIFCCKKRSYTTYHCLSQSLIAAFLESVRKDNNYQGKAWFFLKLKKKPVCFIIIYAIRVILSEFFYSLIYTRK